MSSLFDINNDSNSSDDPDFIPTTGEDQQSDGNISDVADVDTATEEKPKERKKKKPIRDEIINNSILPSEKLETDRRNCTKNSVSNTKIQCVSDVNTKKHIDDVWKSFLNDVNSLPLKSPKSPLKESPNLEINANSSKNCAESTKHNIYEFAGETFTIDSKCKPHAIVSSSITQNDNAAPVVPCEASCQNTTQKRSGLFSVVDVIAKKKQKLTTLQKTSMDWNSFKQSEGIDTKFENFNKGKQGFIERQRFLQWSDNRSFEIEKGMRQTARKKF